MIGVLHLAMGNLRSVGNALTASGRDWRPVEQPAGLDGCTHLIVPGVGAFRTACDRLAASGLHAAVRAFAASGRPVLGICLGMQLLASTGDEGGPSRGLD